MSEDCREIICVGAQGCQSFNPYSGCQHGHHQEQGYWRTSVQGKIAN